MTITYEEVVRRQFEERRRRRAEEARLRAERQRRRVLSNLTAAQGVDPDREARLRHLSAEAGVPLLIAREQENAITALVQAQRANIGYPSLLAGQLEDPRFANLAHDDLEPLSALEEVIGSVASVPQSLAAALLRDIVGRSISGTGHGIASASVLLENWLGDGVEPGEDGTSGTPAGVLIDIGEFFENVGDYVDIDPSQQNFFTQTVGAVGQITGQVLTAYVNRPVAVLSLFGQGADIQAEQLESVGIDANTPEGALAILAGGGVTGLTELVQLNHLMRALPSEGRRAIGAAVARYLGAAVREAAQEGAEAVLQDTITHLTSGGNYEIGQGILREMAVAGTAGGIARILIERLLPGRTRRRSDAQDTQRFLETLDQGARDSRLRHRSPEDFEAFVNAAGQTGTSTLFIDAETFARLHREAGVDPFTAAEQMAGVGRSALDAAIAARGDLAIPVGAWSRHIAGEPISDSLKPHVRRRPDEVSAAELATTDLQTEVRRQAEDLRRRADEGHTIEEGVRRVLADDISPVAEEHRAQWATGAERYLMEGRGPSADLRPVFERFKAWLFDIYKHLDRTAQPVPPEVREVMDRLLATDAQIAGTARGRHAGAGRHPQPAAERERTNQEQTGASARGPGVGPRNRPAVARLSTSDQPSQEALPIGRPPGPDPAASPPAGAAAPPSLMEWRARLYAQGITDRDLELARTEGNTVEQVVARERLRAAFTAAYGTRIPVDGSLNMDQPLEVIAFSSGQVVEQRRRVGGPLGEWYDFDGGQSASQLGISPLARETVQVRVGDGVGLQGIGASGRDNWTISDRVAFGYGGGGRQVIVPRDFVSGFTVDPGTPPVNWRQDPDVISGAVRARTRLLPGWEDSINRNPQWPDAEKRDLIHYLATGDVIDTR